MRMTVFAMGCLAFFASALASDRIADKDLYRKYVGTSQYAPTNIFHSPRRVDEELILAAQAHEPMSAMIAKTARIFAIDPATAAQLVPLEMRLELHLEDSANARATVEGFRRLAESHPKVWLLQDEYVHAIADLDDCNDQRLEMVIARWPDRDDALRRLAESDHCDSIAPMLVARKPDSARSWLLLAKRGGGAAAYRLAVLDIADRMAHSDATTPSAERADIRLRHMREALLEKRLKVALALLPAKDSSEYRAVLEASTADDRITIALAFALEHQPDRAREWREHAQAALDKMKAIPDMDSRASEKFELTSRDKLLASIMEPGASDPFETLAAEVGGVISWGGANFEDLWHDAHDWVAIESGYPALAFDFESDYDSPQDLAAAMKSCQPRCAPVLAVEIRRLAAEPPDRIVPPKPKPAIAPSATLKIAARPGWDPEPLPAAQRTRRPASDPSKDDPFAAPEAHSRPAWAARLPKGELVRQEVRGHCVVAITASQALDPVGEVSSGGYWVSVSNDDGRSFGPPLYTGLQVFAPYVILPASKRPLLNADVLEPEVAIREVDRAKLSFPPIRLPIKRSQGDLYLRMPLAELRRDTDGDGLTDLAEQAMFLDPRSRDTDGDGIADATDPMPQVARDAKPGERTQLLAQALDTILGKSLGAIVTTAAHSGGEPSRGYALGSGTDVYSGAGAQFLSGPAADLRGIDVHTRLIVLSPTQIEQVRHARGEFLPFRISVFEFNRARTEGILVWSTGWTGGTIWFKKVGGKWTTEHGGRWIT